MTTHRLLQLHNLLGTVESKAAVAIRGAASLRRIGNEKGAAHLTQQAARLLCLAARCERHLEAA